jgi:hypothetical protein
MQFPATLKLLIDTEAATHMPWRDFIRQATGKGFSRSELMFHVKHYASLTQHSFPRFLTNSKQQQILQHWVQALIKATQYKPDYLPVLLWKIKAYRIGLTLQDVESLTLPQWLELLHQAEDKKDAAGEFRALRALLDSSPSAIEEQHDTMERSHP